MIRKSVIAGLAFMGLVAAGTMASATPAAAGYACGPWNGWCSWYGGGYGWKGHGYKRHGYWGSPYNNRYWGGYGYGGGKKAYKKGKKKHYGYRNYNKRYYY
jgi:hypothetical protein